MDRLTGDTFAPSDLTRADFEAAVAALDHPTRSAPTMFLRTPSTMRRRERPTILGGCPVVHLLYDPRPRLLRRRRNRVVRRG